MKSFLPNFKSYTIIMVLMILLSLITNNGFAATKTWNGGTGTNLNWTTSSNWSPSGVPASGDDVVFNTPGTLTFTTGPGGSISLNSFTVSQGTVTLVAGTARTLTLGGNAGTDFTIASGASFVMGTNISITLANNATADISGTFTINTGRTYTNTGTGVVTTVTGTINCIGILSNTTASKLLFQSGSTYTHNQNGGTIPTATWNASSTCNITGLTTTDPSGDGQAFGNLTYNCSGMSGNRSMATSGLTIAGNFQVLNTGSGQLRMSQTPLTIGGNLTVNDNFRIGSNTNRTLDVTGNVSIGGGTTDISDGSGIGTLNVGGNFSATAGTVTESGTSTTSGINFNGTGAQTFTAGATFSNNIHFTINNASGVTLLSSVNLPASLTLTSGILSISAGSTLQITNGSVIGGSPFSASKHIATLVDYGTGSKGFLRVNNMANATAYLFPTGDGTNYLPATLTPGSATIANNTYSVCAFPGLTSDGEPNGVSFSTPQKNNCVDAVWRVNYNGPGAPTAPATNMTVAWPASLEGVNFSGYSNPLIGIAHYDGPNWGTVVGTGDNTANTATRNGITTFSPFAVGKIDPSGGILAIKLVYFNAAKANGYNTINWQANCSSSQAIFELLRSTDGINFMAINSLVASQARCAQPFSFNDNSASAGIVYYRLKMVDVDGKVTYSAIVKLSSQAKDIELAGIAPNPVVNIAQVKVNTVKKDAVSFTVISAEGKMVYRKNVEIQPGSSIVNLDLTNLPKGVYMIKGLFSDGQTNTIKFIK